MTNKTERVLELLGEGKSTKEIIDEVGCSKATVSNARTALKNRIAEEEPEEPEIEEEEDDGDMTEAIDSFIRKIKITPDKEVLTDDDEKSEDIEYGCNCGAVWNAPKGERQTECPECGMEFD